MTLVGGGARETRRRSMKPLGDRRARVRFEVVGVLWGALDLTEVARVVNISTTGALIESPLAVAIDSTQPLHFLLDGNEIVVETRVRHLRRLPTAADAPRYMIGVEFVSPSLSVLQSLMPADNPDTMVE
jgi:hypothetical protein